MRILAVDDDEGRIKLMEQMLTPHGYTVERFMPNEIMREDFPFGDYCAITLDNDMCLRETDEEAGCPNPAKWGGCECPTGLDVARWIEAHKDLVPKVPIILVTNNGVAPSFMIFALEGFTTHRFPQTQWFRADNAATQAFLRLLKGPQGNE